jgi:hypothetical protein
MEPLRWREFYVHVNRSDEVFMLVRAFLVMAAIAVAGTGLAPIAAARPYANCTQAHKDGRWDIPQDDPAYWSGGDRDGDGIACES